MIGYHLCMAPLGLPQLLLLLLLTTTKMYRKVCLPPEVQDGCCHVEMCHGVLACGCCCCLTLPLDLPQTSRGGV